MTPDLLSALIGLTLFCLGGLDAPLLQTHEPILARAGLILGALGARANQVGYLK